MEERLRVGDQWSGVTQDFERILLKRLLLVNFVATQQCKNKFSLHLLLQNLEVSILLPIFAP